MLLTQQMEVNMMRNVEQTIGNLIDKQSVSFISSVDDILPNYPRASLVLLDKAAHALQVEQDVLFTGTVNEWLDRVSFELD